MNDEQPTPLTPPVEPPVINATAPQATPKKSRKKLLFGSIAAAVLLLAASSAFAYSAIYQNPDRVVHDAIINAVQAKTASLTGKVSLKAEGFDVTLDMDSKTGTKDGEFSVKTIVAVDQPDFKRTFTADASTKMIGDTMYVRLNGIKGAVDEALKTSEIVLPGEVNSIIEKIDGKWISIKASDYGDISEDMSEQQACFTALSEKIQSDTNAKNEVVQLYRDNQIVVITEKLGSKDVNGTSSLGFKVDANKDAAASLIRGLENTTVGKEAKKCSDEIDFNKIADDIAESKAPEGEATIELWVSRFGHEVTEVVLNGKNDETSISAFFQPVFNKDVNIDVPQDAISIKDLLDDIQELMAQPVNGATISDPLYFDMSA